MSYGYDADGNLDAVTDSSGTATSFAYDSEGDQTSAQWPDKAPHPESRGGRTYVQRQPTAVRCRTQDGADDAIVEASEVLPEEQRAEEGTHLLLDAHTLRPLAELDYPHAPGASALPLGDGTWLAHDGETVLCWATA